MAEQAGEEREEQNEDSKPSVFPLFPLSDSLSTASRSPQWLCNSSFTVNISSAQPPAAAFHYDSAAGEKNDSEDDEVRPTKPPPDYKLLDSSASDCEKEEMPKKKKKKKRKRDSLRGEDSGVPRKSGVEVWACSETKKNKDYYFDAKGDRDNLAFGCLYRMDVARYRLHSPTSTSSFNLQVLHRWRKRISTMDLDEDADSFDSKSREIGRYFSAKYATLERHKDFRHLRVVALQKISTIPGAFIPFSEAETSHEHDSHGPQVKAELEESWEEEVLRKTKEFNMMSREFPHDGQLWLAFAEFQDKIAAKQPQKAARLQIMEKKISILEKAVELNPDNDDLLLSLLKAYQGRDSTEVLNEKWEKILLQHSGNCKLWKEFLGVCQGDFSRFKVSNTRKIYTYAIQAISAACNKLCRQADQSARLQIADPILVQLELGLVDIFVNLCKFEWQTGYQELSTALFQAEIEYSLFCPSLLLTEQSKHTLFEHFWSSSGARIGEDGAIGWSKCLEKEENRQSTSAMDFPQENEVGGWTGWTEPLSRKNVTNEEEEKLEEDDAGEDFEDEDMKQEEDVYSLMKKLGINIDFEAGTDVKDPSTWIKWSKKESSRDYEQWMPMRENSGVSSTDETPTGQVDEQFSRVILFEDVSEYLFSLRSEEAQFFLVTQFVDFFGGKISRGLCTNTPSWTENCLSLETFPDSILEDLRKVHEAVTGTRSSSSHFTLESLLGSSDDARRQIDVIKFLRNALFLCLNAFPRNYILEEALIAVEELFCTQLKPFSSSVTPSRALAKSLLKNDRQDLLLCGVYARNEAAYGNIDLARRVFDMALTSIEGLPLDLQANAPLLYYWYSEMELAACGSGGTLEPSPIRAIHILSCLGNGVKYSSFKCQPSSLQLLKARQGFKEQIKKVCSAWARGDVKDQSVALICSASLFEDLTMGLGSGIAIFEEAFSAVLPGRRSESYYLESLFNHYIKMLQKNLRQSKLLKVWESILQGLQIYPYNPKLFAAFVEVGCLYTVPNKLRQIFDQYCRRKPSLVVWLFALSYELVKAGSQHRIKGLFERALDDYKLQKSVLLWRCYLAYEINLGNFSAARRIFFRAIHACPWSKKLWLDGFLKLHKILTAKELSDLQEVMRDKELHLRTDIYEILLQDEASG